MPSVDKQYSAVGLVHLIELEGNKDILLTGDLQVESRDEETDTSSAGWETLRKVAGSPLGGVESGKMPALTFAEETSFVEDTTNLIGVAKQSVEDR